MGFVIESAGDTPDLEPVDSVTALAPRRGGTFAPHQRSANMAEKPRRSKLQLEVMALAALDPHTVSVTVRRLSPPDRNWNWELASIQPTRSGHGQAQADRSILPLQFAFDLDD